MTFWNVWRSLYKENLWGGWQPAVRTTVWNPDWQSYRFCKHWVAGNHSAICIWGKTRRKAIWIHWLWSCNWRRIMQWHFHQRLTISGNRLSNKLGRNKGCSVLLQDKALLAAFNYCANHDLNLVLGKCSKVSEIHVMLDSLKQIGIFFKYSPAWFCWFEDCVEQHHRTLPKIKRLPTRDLRCFGKQDRWKKKIVFEDFWKMYGPLLQCIESIRSNGWDDNSFIRVSGLLKLITYSTFIAAFHKIRYFFGFTHRFNLTLRGSECDILKVFQILGSVKQVLQNVRSNIDETFASAYV